MSSTDGGPLPASWQEVSLGEVAELINGDRGKNYPSKKNRVASGIPFINAGHLGGGIVQLSTMDYITPAHFERLRGGRVQADDVLLCIRGSIGRAALVHEDVAPAAIASSLVILRPGPDLDPRFLLAYLTGPVGSSMILSYDNGAAQPNIGARDVARFVIPLPPLPTQRKIATILFAFDKHVEYNNRRIKLLEETARRIYREWFVEFRYPGHEDVPMVASALGPVPKNWSIDSVGDHVEVVRLPQEEEKMGRLIQALRDARYALGVFVVAAVSTYLSSREPGVIATVE
jgi:restriction endonuclease S subunit